MTTSLATLLAAVLCAQGPTPQAANPSKPEQPTQVRTATSTVVRSFVLDDDGKLELLDDHGIAWVPSGALGHELPVDVLGPRRYIGVQLITLTPELRRHFGVPSDRGVMVSKVLPDTPAATAGIEVGDVLVAADGAKVEAAGDVTRVLTAKEPGEEVGIELWRDGDRMRLRVGFEERKAVAIDLDGARLPLLHEKIQAPHDAQSLANKAIVIRAVRPEEVDEAMHALDQYLQTEEWQERLRQIKGLDLDAVQQRVKTLERRLEQLERQLAEKRR